MAFCTWQQRQQLAATALDDVAAVVVAADVVVVVALVDLDIVSGSVSKTAEALVLESLNISGTSILLW